MWKYTLTCPHACNTSCAISEPKPLIVQLLIVAIEAPGSNILVKLKFAIKSKSNIFEMRGGRWGKSDDSPTKITLVGAVSEVQIVLRQKSRKTLSLNTLLIICIKNMVIAILILVIFEFKKKVMSTLRSSSVFILKLINEIFYQRKCFFSTHNLYFSY